MIRYIIMLFVIAFMSISCTKEVPPGYIGMKMSPDNGLEGDILKPGRHSIYNRDKLILVERVERTKTERLSILCKDDLNFKFDVKVRATINANSSKELKMLIDKQGANIDWNDSVGKLKFKDVYNTYISPIARSIARSTVSQYETRQISGARKTIQSQILKELVDSCKGLPVKITMVAISNLDYPKVITMAMEKKKKRQIQIEQEKANQAIELLRANNRLKIAQKMKVVRVAEAEAEAAYMKILGSGATQTYLNLKNIEARLKLYGNIGPGDKLIITNGNKVVPVITSGRSGHVPIPMK